MKLLSLLSAVSMICFLTACEHDHDHEEGHDHSTGGETSTEQAQLLACTAVQNNDHIMVEASTSADDLSNAVIMPDEKAFMVNVPQGASGFVEIQVPEEHGDWLLFSNQAGAIKGLTHMGSAESVGTSVANAQCSTDLPAQHTLHIHTKTGFTLELASEDGGAVMLYLVSSSTSGEHSGHNHEGEDHEGHEGHGG